MASKQNKMLESYRIGKRNNCFVSQKTHQKTVDKYEELYGKDGYRQYRSVLTKILSGEIEPAQARELHPTILPFHIKNFEIALNAKLSATKCGEQYEAYDIMTNDALQLEMDAEFKTNALLHKKKPDQPKRRTFGKIGNAISKTPINKSSFISISAADKMNETASIHPEETWRQPVKRNTYMSPNMRDQPDTPKNASIKDSLMRTNDEKKSSNLTNLRNVNYLDVFNKVFSNDSLKLLGASFLFKTKLNIEVYVPDSWHDDGEISKATECANDPAFKKQILLDLKGHLPNWEIISSKLN
jgi:hypothetical protein